MTPPLVNAFVAFSPLIGVALEAAEPETIARYGLAGAVIYFLMVKADKRLSGIEHKIVGVNRALLIELLSRPGTTPQGRRAAREELKKIDPGFVEDGDGSGE